MLWCSRLVERTEPALVRARVHVHVYMYVSVHDILPAAFVESAVHVYAYVHAELFIVAAPL